MITIQLICIGSLKEQALVTLCEEYKKRISKYAKIQVIELEEERCNKNLSPLEEEQVKEKECKRILTKLQSLGKSYVFALDMRGNTYNSEQFAQKVSEIAIYSSSVITFIIGGSLGLTDELRKGSDSLISFSTLTFPHQLMRVFLLEQLFRVCKINNNERYHK